MSKEVRLISRDGAEVMECTIQTHFPTAIIFGNRVFTFAYDVGDWKHYREVGAERVRDIDHARTSSIPTSLNPKPKTGD